MENIWSHIAITSSGPVINSSRGGGGRHLGGETKILHIQREGGWKIKSILREILRSFF